MRVAKAAEDNTIARIIRLVEEAQEARAPTERFIDRFSRWYMPLIVGSPSSSFDAAAPVRGALGRPGSIAGSRSC